MNVPAKVELIGDSLLAVSSNRTPAVGIIRKNGEQVGNIASGDFPIGAFMPTSYNISDYPIVYIIDRRSQSVLVFNVVSQEFIEKIRLDLPEDKIIRTIGAEFKKTKEGFLVELYDQKYDAYLPDFYRNSGDLLYFFDSNGKFQKSIKEYPEEYKAMDGSLSPTNYLKMSDNNQTILLSFPHSKKLHRYTNKGEELEQLDLPPSRVFDYQLKAADRIIDFKAIMAGEKQSAKTPDNHYFNSLYEDEKSIYIETWMKIGEGGIEKTRFAHLMVYNKEEEKWYETQNPKGILDIGMLAGVANDTLYFYEGSMMKYDDKYIKRAILKPIEE
ncbi:hypothetical protein LZF95_10735 [Algoriphagus sp. AGSA1]|uniref:hypothetical protein n=1 Tax=Algoriphagus sp. AGSA1 TaxID=2907213 RepID=UPI001F213B07|nr:hypothetical protein [Algoriphagus sp. AGSA1]MCE7055152.1 hypothetical protein [Algoriphagus sp. AGSA1]